MGADMLIEYVQIDLKKKPDFRNGKAFLRNLVKKPKAHWPQEFVDHHVEEGIANPSPVVLAMLMKDLYDLKIAWMGRTRDSRMMEVGQKKIMITGGLSYGDSPTELFTTIDRLRSAGIIRACGFEF